MLATPFHSLAQLIKSRYFQLKTICSLPSYYVCWLRELAAVARASELHFTISVAHNKAKESIFQRNRNNAKCRTVATTKQTNLSLVSLSWRMARDFDTNCCSPPNTLHKRRAQNCVTIRRDLIYLGDSQVFHLTTVGWREYENRAGVTSRSLRFYSHESETLKIHAN